MKLFLLIMKNVCKMLAWTNYYVCRPARAVRSEACHRAVGESDQDLGSWYSHKLTFHASLISTSKDFHFHLKNKKKGTERMHIVMAFKNKKREGKKRGRTKIPVQVYSPDLPAFCTLFQTSEPRNVLKYSQTKLIVLIYFLSTWPLH